MEYFYAGLIFIFGAALGSFINVIADRYNTGLSFVKARSFCFSCGNTLTKRDLFPIFSFIFLKGKCRHCSSKIPKSALIVEIIMGFLSVLMAFKSGIWSGLELKAWSLEEGISYLFLTIIFATILLLSVYDLRHFIIPDTFLVAFFVFVLSSKLFAPSLSTITFDLISGVVLLIPFLLIFLASKGRWIGFGDVKYIFVIGFFLGIIQGLSAVILAFWIGALFSLTILLLQKINLPKMIICGRI